MEKERRRRKTRRRGNYYSSKLMRSEDRAELRRAAKVEGLEDEIALLRMRLKRAAVEDEEDLEVLSLGMERLSRAIGLQHRMSPKKGEDWIEKWEEMIRGFEDQMYPDGMDRPWWCLPPREGDDWKYREGHPPPGGTG